MWLWLQVFQFTSVVHNIFSISVQTWWSHSSSEGCHWHWVPTHWLCSCVWKWTWSWDCNQGQDWWESCEARRSVHHKQGNIVVKVFILKLILEEISQLYIFSVCDRIYSRETKFCTHNTKKAIVGSCILIFCAHVVGPYTW